jgi:two-component system phosphate regulon response regulator PhoB
MTSTNNPAHRVLVVDDDPDISMMLKLMLEYKGYEVTLLARPDQTLETLQGGSYSMAIIDMLLSGVSGIDICSRIRSNPATASCPVLMISAHPNAKEICLQAGADDFISKPFDMHDILSRIAHLVTKPG